MRPHNIQAARSSLFLALLTFAFIFLPSATSTSSPWCEQRVAPIVALAKHLSTIPLDLQGLVKEITKVVQFSAWAVAKKVWTAPSG